MLGRAATTAREADASGDEVMDGDTGDTQDPAAAEEREVIRNLQTSLNALGYDAGKADGLLGPRTRDAIDSFRATEGIDPSITEPTVLLARADTAAETQAATPAKLPVDREAAVAETTATSADQRLPALVAPEPATMHLNRGNSDRDDSGRSAGHDTLITLDGRGPPSSWKSPLNALDLIGRVMTNDRGMKLGEVRNLLFERDGRIAGLLVRIGGFHLLGDAFANIIGEPGRVIAVPWSEVKIDWYGRVLVDMTWSDVENAKTFDPDIATAAVDM